MILWIQNFLRSLGFQFVRSPITWVFKYFPINCVLDVAANDGEYGSMLRGIGYKGWIISFEPIRSTYEALARIAAKDARWRVFQYARGTTRGQFEINHMIGSDFDSFLEPVPESQVLCKNNVIQGTETVEVYRLEEVLGECTKGIPAPRIYLKLDTQGFDLEVIKGAQGILPQVLGLQSELSFRPIYRGMKSYAESIAELNTYGFHVVDFIPVTRDLDDLCVIEMDCVMTRRPDWTLP